MSDIQSAIQNVLDELVATGQEVGLQAAAYVEGELVADCVAGVVGRDSRTPVAHDTLFPLYSCSKGITATAVHLVAQRGLLDYDSPVSRYWPEFAAGGKESVTVAQALNHLAGIPQVPRRPDITVEQLICDLDLATAETARLTPMFAPGTTACYHGLTIGWIAAGLVYRVDGRPLGQLVGDEIVRPLNLEDELFLGTPAAVDTRMATPYDAPVPIEELPARDPLVEAVIAISEPIPDFLNRTEVRRAQIPAANISATARALARHYAALVSEVDGCRLLSDDHLENMFSRQAVLPDVFMNAVYGTSQETPRVLGYQRNTGRDTQEFYYGPNLRAFGHGGYGGSCGFADPERKVGFGYVKTLLPGFTRPDETSKLRPLQPDEMSRARVMKALYAAIS